MADPTLKTALADPKLRPAVLAWAKRTHIDDEIDFIVDMLQKKEARQIYRDYIAKGAPRAINLADKDLDPARQLVATGSFKPTALRTILVDITQKQFSWIQLGTFAQGNNSFLISPEYLALQTATVTRDPKVAEALTLLKLSGAKAETFVGLVNTYLKPRTIADSHQAYLAMQKLANKAKLDKVLAELGRPADTNEYQYQAHKLIPAIQKAQTEATKFITEATQTVKTKGKPGDPVAVTRMFNSARMRVEKANTDYVKAVRLDKAFATKNVALAAAKKKIDELWGDYRQLLGK